MIEEFNQSSEELFDILLAAESIENQANGISTYAVVGPDILGTIKDTTETLDSVPQRMELFVTMARAIKFFTSDIRYKGPDAQLKMTAYITTGLIKVVNSNTSVDEMKEYALKFEDIASELTALPDLADDARANMYLRVDLDQEIARVKDMYKYELEDKSTYVIDELDDAVKAARRIRMRSRSTVADIKLAFENLESAVNKALESTDYRASQEEINQLKALRNDLRRENIRDERRDHVNSLVRAANQELGKKRPAKDKVAELVQEIQAIMDFQEANTAPTDQVEKLKDLKTQLQRARINDHRRERVLQIIRESNQEISKRRSDKEKVQALIIEIEEILQPEENFQPELVEEIA